MRELLVAAVVLVSTMTEPGTGVPIAVGTLASYWPEKNVNACARWLADQQTSLKETHYICADFCTESHHLGQVCSCYYVDTADWPSYCQRTSEPG